MAISHSVQLDLARYTQLVTKQLWLHIMNNLTMRIIIHTAVYIHVGPDGQSVLVICVPSFDLTHSAVLVRLRAGGWSHRDDVIMM